VLRHQGRRRDGPGRPRDQREGGICGRRARGAACPGTRRPPREAGIPVYGACAAGARLEASKTFTKEILLKYGIPTAAAGMFSEVAPALEYLRSRENPIVVKADGLAAGKGVVVAATRGGRTRSARCSRRQVRGRRPQVLIEDCLVGEETSILVVVSGTGLRDPAHFPGPQADRGRRHRAEHRRHGRLFAGRGRDPALLERIDSEIVRPSVDAIAREGSSSAARSSSGSC
jgi:phosphoribosylamine--glycine ligase